MPLTDEQLHKLSTQRLLNLLQIARNTSFQANNAVEYCEIGSEEEFGEMAKEFEADNYFERIKKVLDTRPHHNRNKRKPVKYDRVTKMR